MNFKKEASYASFVTAGSGLFGSLIGVLVAILVTRMTFAENRRVQTEANRRQAYTQLAGEKAELLMLLQQLAKAHDKGTFYEGRAAQSIATANQPAKANNQRRPSPQVKGVSYRESYQSEAIQQERNVECYNDEVVTCAQKMFESIAPVQLSFPPDQQLDNKIVATQAMLTRTDDVFPRESLRERLAWVMATEDAEQQLSIRQKQHMAYIEKAVQPVTDLLDYIRTVQ